MNLGGTGISTPDNFSYRSNFLFRSSFRSRSRFRSNFHSRFSFSFRFSYRSSSSYTTSGDIFYCSGSRQLNHSICILQCIYFQTAYLMIGLYIWIMIMYMCMLFLDCVHGCVGPLPKGVSVQTLLSPVREVSTPPPSPSYDSYDDTVSLPGNYYICCFCYL